MLTATTATLANKLSKALGLKLDKASIVSGDYLFGKLQVKNKIDKLPAISLERTSIQVDRENRIRPVAGIQGIPINIDGQSGKKDILRVIPILVTYSISIFVRGSDERDKIESDLIWFLESGKENLLDIPVVIAGLEALIPVEISVTSAQGINLSLNRKEDWEEYKIYRIDFDLDVKTFLLKHTTQPIITKVEYTIIDDEIILAEG